MQKDVRAIAPPAMEQLLAHSWPGNVRELENSIQRALAVATDDTIRSFQLLPAVSGSAAGTHVTGPAITVPIGTPLATAEDRLITETLKQCNGDKEKAARMLGVSSRTLYRRFSKGDS
jgi:DNA-binding NtrC family response regulator